MPIFINSTQHWSKSRMSNASWSRWLHQSLAKFLSNHNSRNYSNLQCEDSYDPGSSLNYISTPRAGNFPVIISTHRTPSGLAFKAMQRNLQRIRLKWKMISRGEQHESPDLIMLNTQYNLLGYSSISKHGDHSYLYPQKRINIDNNSIIHALDDPKRDLQAISDQSKNEVHSYSFLKVCLIQVLNDLSPQELPNQLQVETFDYRDAFRKKNYRYPNALHSFQSNNDYAAPTSFSRTLYILYAALADRLSNLDKVFAGFTYRQHDYQRN